LISKLIDSLKERFILQFKWEVQRNHTNMGNYKLVKLIKFVTLP